MDENIASETRCEKCGEVTMQIFKTGGVVIPSSGHRCKGTVDRAERDLVRVIGWPLFNELKAQGKTQGITNRLAALERVADYVKSYRQAFNDEIPDVIDESAKLLAIFTAIDELEAMDK